MSESKSRTIEEISVDIEKQRKTYSEYKVTLTPTHIDLIIATFSRLNDNGLIKLEEMGAIATVFNELSAGKKSFEEFSQRITSTLEFLNNELANAKSGEIDKRLTDKNVLIEDERRLRKSLEKQLQDAMSSNEELRQKLPKGPSTKSSDLVSNKPVITKSNVSLPKNEVSLPTNEVKQIVVPNREELENLTKNEIVKFAEDLGFKLDAKLGKKDMIELFVIESEKIIKELMSKNDS